MAGRALMIRAEPGFSLPVFDRLAPPPPPEILAARIEAHTRPGDVVVDLHGRGGWVARAAVDRQRGAVSFESTPLNRLLAEIVLRPPDIRHLDAALQALAASPRRESSLKVSIGDLFATRCPGCSRTLVVDEVVWETRGGDGPAADAADADESRDRAATTPWGRPIRKSYRCTLCRDQLGGSDRRQSPLDDEDVARAGWSDEATAVRARLRDRFPVPDDGDGLVDDLLDLHTPRQLVALAAIIDRIESDLRAEPIEAVLRLAFLHAIVPASRLNTMPGRGATLRIAGGRVRFPMAGQWRERNPWLVYEDAFRIVRGFVHRLEGSTLGPTQARLATDLRSLVEGSAVASVRLGTPSAYRALAAEARELARAGGRARPNVRLVVGQPPVRPGTERLSLGYAGTAWALGREAAAMLPVEPLFDASLRIPWSWHAASIRRSLEAVEPVLARDGRAVLLLDPGGADAVVAGALGAAAAGYRILAAHVAEPDSESAGILEFLPPGAAVPPGPRTRANVPLGPGEGGAGDPDVVPGSGMFAPPERYDRRPFSAADAARTVTETAVAVLKARGEPARLERLLGEILVGLDRDGHLRRLTAVSSDGSTGQDPDRDGEHLAGSAESGGPGPDHGTGRPPGAQPALPEPPAALPASPGRARTEGLADIVPTRRSPRPQGADPVERLLAIVRDELGRETNQRLVEIEPDRWWLADRADREAAAPPLADRVEWAVYSLLSTAGPIAESAFLDRIASLFSGHDLADEGLVRACLESYRSRAGTADRLITAEDLPRRSHEHSEMLALLAETGHRLGMSVWIAAREQTRRLGDRVLGDWLDERERRAYLPQASRGPVDALEAVDCMWYVRGRATLMFEVEWTAMLGEPILRRHARIPPEDHVVRFLVLAPERTELARHKLDRSPLLRAALEAGNWHVLKWNHLRAFAALEEASLAALEPFLGLDPLAERRGEQLPLF